MVLDLVKECLLRMEINQGQALIKFQLKLAMSQHTVCLIEMQTINMFDI